MKNYVSYGILHQVYHSPYFRYLDINDTSTLWQKWVILKIKFEPSHFL